MNNYIQNDNLQVGNIDKYITPSFWGSNAGIVGAAYLAKLAYDESKK